MKNDDPICLNEIAELGLMIVYTPIDRVLEFYAKFFLPWSELRPISYNMYGDEILTYGPIRALRSGTVRNAASFGDISKQEHSGPGTQFRTYELYGCVRVSSLVGLEGVTLVEGPCNDVNCFDGSHLLASDLKARTITFRSFIRYDKTHYAPPKQPQPCFFHQMMIDDPMRDVRCLRAWEDGDRQTPGNRGPMTFTNTGEIQPWENPDHYKKRLIRERFNRNIICEYLAALGIDPEATFLRREFDDVVLFTDDPEGADLKTLLR